MNALAYFFVAVAGLLHVYTFAMESLLWGGPLANRVFRVSPEKAEHNRLFAYNQGFYNLFLALGAFTGIGLCLSSSAIVGATLIVYSCLSMAGAGLVLLFSEPKLMRAALIQFLPPFAGVVLLVSQWL